MRKSFGGASSPRLHWLHHVIPLCCSGSCRSVPTINFWDTSDHSWLFQHSSVRMLCLYQSCLALPPPPIQLGSFGCNLVHFTGMRRNESVPGEHLRALLELLLPLSSVIHPQGRHSSCPPWLPGAPAVLTPCAPAFLAAGSARMLLFPASLCSQVTLGIF